MLNRRKFIEKAAALGIISVLPSKLGLTNNISAPLKPAANFPVILSTWSFGKAANSECLKILTEGGSVVDAVEKGIMVTEADPLNSSVGIGGFPDRDGKVTLDASIMGPDGNAGSVSFLEEIVHPVSVARKVMEETPHIMLSGDGALQFAVENGFKRQNLLTPKMEKEWKRWAKKAKYDPKINWEENPNENHDTIGLLAIDVNSQIAGACSTSGLAGKVRGRVGDSPIIGAGLFVDNEVGAATATGMGELMMKTLTTFLVVEFMRNGNSPQMACERAIRRIAEKLPEHEKYQVGILAINKEGETGAYSLQPGFQYTLNINGVNHQITSAAHFKELPKNRKK